MGDEAQAIGLESDLGLDQATCTAEAITRIDRFVTHPGQEFLLVLDGRVTVHLEGMDPVTLEEGDSIYFDSNRGHLYASALDRESRILVVCTELAENDPEALSGD